MTTVEYFFIYFYIPVHDETETSHGAEENNSCETASGYSGDVNGGRCRTLDFGIDALVLGDKIAYVYQRRSILLSVTLEVARESVPRPAQTRRLADAR